ncbi:MAG: IS21-like element helper ATPase IstB [Candidatus Omnitrophota bacterium]
MIESTISKLSAMRLHAMADKTREMSNSPKLSSMNPLDFVAFLVDAEFDRRENGKVSRLLRNAHIKQTMACIENVEFSARRNLKKEVLVDVLTGTFIDNKTNALINGPTGCGKSYLASALANLACRKCQSTMYYRMPRFLEILTAEKALGNYLEIIEKIGKLKLLVLDDLGPDVMSKEQRNMFLEIIEERYLTGSTIITSQLPFEQWYEVFGDPTVADAICDRLFHNAHKIQIEGDSMRKK